MDCASVFEMGLHDIRYRRIAGSGALTVQTRYHPPGGRIYARLGVIHTDRAVGLWLRFIHGHTH